jgi:hypothetical protein
MKKTALMIATVVGLAAAASAPAEARGLGFHGGDFRGAGFHGGGFRHGFGFQRGYGIAGVAAAAVAAGVAADAYYGGYGYTYAPIYYAPSDYGYRQDW